MSARSALSNIIRSPTVAYYYGQKAIRSPFLRRSLGAAMAGLIGQAKGYGGGEASDGVARELEDTGLCRLPRLQLSSADLRQIRDDLRGKPVVDFYDATKQFDIDVGVPFPYTRLGYKMADLVSCEPLVRLANSPLILDAVSQVLGARPTIGWLESWWTFGEHHQAGKTYFDDVYHRDVDDLRFVKLFVYLTDTDENNGAHSFVLKSHRSPLLVRRGPITDSEVQKAFPADDILTITGVAGTAFLESTWGIHRPLLATQGRRHIFSVLYSLTPWLPTNLNFVPTHKLPGGLDPYVNRALFRT